MNLVEAEESPKGQGPPSWRRRLRDELATSARTVSVRVHGTLDVQAVVGVSGITIAARRRRGDGYGTFTLAEIARLVELGYSKPSGRRVRVPELRANPPLSGTGRATDLVFAAIEVAGGDLAHVNLDLGWDWDVLGRDWADAAHPLLSGECETAMADAPRDRDNREIDLSHNFGAIRELHQRIDRLDVDTCRGVGLAVGLPMEMMAQPDAARAFARHYLREAVEVLLVNYPRFSSTFVLADRPLVVANLDPNEEVSLYEQPFWMVVALAECGLCTAPLDIARQTVRLQDVDIHRAEAIWRHAFSVARSALAVGALPAATETRVNARLRRRISLLARTPRRTEDGH